LHGDFDPLRSLNIIKFPLKNEFKFLSQNETTADGLGSNDCYGVAALGIGATAQVYAANSTGLSISTNGGTNFIHKSTANGLAQNFTVGVAFIGSGSAMQTLTMTSNAGLSVNSP
jgi:hypothetical protein